MKLLFIGSGYVGLTTGIMLSYIGHDVVLFDKDLTKIKSLQNNILPIYEPGLDEYFHQVRSSNKLNSIQNYDGLTNIDAVFIAVGTPSLEDGSADLSNVYAAALEVAKCDPNVVIIIKSTVPPGTNQSVQQMLQNHGYFNEVVSNPEFLREGNAVEDFMHPDRIVIGLNTESIAKSVMEDIYSYFINKNFRLIFCDPSSAELIKYTSNAFLAIKISFINEIANLSEKLNADIDVVAHATGLDHRIGEYFLKTGPGFGGSCFPKDLLALTYLARSCETKSQILDATLSANNQRPYDMVKKIEDILGDLQNKVIAVLGLSFKAGTDDVRNSPAVMITKLIQDRGAVVQAYDPCVTSYPDMKICQDVDKACYNTDAIVILTEWPEFAYIDYSALLVNQKIIFDYRNMLDPVTIKKQGYSLYQLGKNING